MLVREVPQIGVTANLLLNLPHDYTVINASPWRCGNLVTALLIPQRSCCWAFLRSWRRGAVVPSRQAELEQQIAAAPDWRLVGMAKRDPGGNSSAACNRKFTDRGPRHGADTGIAKQCGVGLKSTYASVRK